MGWYTKADRTGDLKLKADGKPESSAWTLTEDATLYAWWKFTVTLMLDAENKYGDYAMYSYDNRISYTKPADPDGYMRSGWKVRSA